MANKQHEFQMQVKAVAEDGTFEGILSPYGNVDDGGDVVDAGAFTKTLQENGNTVPMLWQHKTDCPIGELTLQDRQDGLYCTGKFLLDIPDANKAYLLLKSKIIKGLSIGYEAIKSQVVGGVRHLKEIRLYEGSVVTFPMNALAAVTSVKSHDVKGDFTEELGDIQLRAADTQYYCALSNALCMLPWSGLSRDEIMETASAVIEQFTAAYLDYLPKYLDYLTETYGIDVKSWPSRMEMKEGRKLSGSTKSTLSEAHQHVKDATDILSALLEEEAEGDDADTSDSEAADEEKSEPIIDHSAAKALADMRLLLK